MTYISYAERKGMEKGLEKGLEQGRAEGIRLGLRAIVETKFGAAGVALVDQLPETTDVAKLDGLTRAAAKATTLDDLRPLFADNATVP